MLSSALPPCLTTHPELTGQEGEKWGGGHLQGAAPLGSLLGAEAPVFPKEPRSLRLHREEMGPSRRVPGAGGGWGSVTTPRRPSPFLSVFGPRGTAQNL